MPRIARRASTTGLYHVIARGHNRKAVFLDSEDYRRYLLELTRFKQQFPCRCYHFCLMPNHVHLLLHTERVEELTALMRRTQQAYQLHWRYRYGLVGHLWQGRFKSLPIQDESYLLECGRYIERNPVRADLCKSPEEYPWSSAKMYLFGQQDGLSFLDSNPAYKTLGPTDSTRQQLYRAYVCQARPYEQLVDTQLQRLI